MLDLNTVALKDQLEIRTANGMFTGSVIDIIPAMLPVDIDKIKLITIRMRVGNILGLYVGL